MRRILILFLLLSILPPQLRAEDAGMKELHSLLGELDALLARRNEFYIAHERRMDSLKWELRRPGVEPVRQYDLVEELAELYAAYQSDSSLVYLKRGLEIARKMDDNNLLIRAKSQMVMCYSIKGLFFEAEQMFGNNDDTLRMDERTCAAYYMAQHRKFREMRYQADPLQRDYFAGKELYYGTRVVETNADHRIRLAYHYLNAMCLDDWAQVEIYCDSVLTLCKPGTHAYAKAANHMSFVEGAKGNQIRKICWHVRSAISDIRSAVRDYGSLVAVSEELLKLGDVDRAMHYIRISINDTRFFNSPIRSWRDLSILIQIDRAYNQRSERLHSMYVLVTIIAVLFSLSAIGFILFVMRQNRRLSAVQQTLRESNVQLNTLADNLTRANRHLRRKNAHIADANRIKEVYIGGFLQTISEYINKLADTHRYVNKMLRDDKIAELKREYAGSNVRYDELKEFYTLFDTTFLHLFPSFIDEFNALLLHDARIEIRKTDTLNTELRIFALIRLGIKDTSTIAALLHCSVNTVYNYRSRLRQQACDPGGDFEQRVQTIGMTEL